MPPNALFIKANILIDDDGHARLADFGLLTIISDPMNFTASSSLVSGGTTRWMSPELLHPDQFGLEDSRPTKESDCYALGMVIYEVLSGQAPFMPLKNFIVMRKVTEGERPARPGGAKGAWFTDDLWGVMNLCWEAQPANRPNIAAVLECLDRVSGTWKPPSPRVDEGVAGVDEDEWHFTLTVSDSPARFLAPIRFRVDHACDPPPGLTDQTLNHLHPENWAALEFEEVESG